MNRYEESMADIAIAQEALEKSLLPGTMAGKPLLCDVYCIPSHNHQAFYLQVYGGTEYTLLFAKTLFTDRLGEKIVMYPFEYVQKAVSGDICCGMQQLPSSNSLITLLLQTLPKVEEICLDSSPKLDGTLTVVRDCQCNPPIALGYYKSYQIENNFLRYEQGELLDDLHLRIEGIIGNLLRN